MIDKTKETHEKLPMWLKIFIPILFVGGGGIIYWKRKTLFPKLFPIDTKKVLESKKVEGKTQTKVGFPMKYGSGYVAAENNFVKDIQYAADKVNLLNNRKTLILQNSKAGVDGKWGSGTEAAVKAAFNTNVITEDFYNNTIVTTLETEDYDNYVSSLLFAL